MSYLILCLWYCALGTDPHGGLFKWVDGQVDSPVMRTDGRLAGQPPDCLLLREEAGRPRL